MVREVGDLSSTACVPVSTVCTVLRKLNIGLVGMHSLLTSRCEWLQFLFHRRLVAESRSRDFPGKVRDGGTFL